MLSGIGEYASVPFAGFAGTRFRELPVMASITEVAQGFFVACEAGNGWEACKAFCKPQATFSAQVESLVDVRTLEQYANWMQGLLKILPDGRYDLKAFATDDARKTVVAYAQFTGTHTGPGGPCEPTGKMLKGSDYVYVMQFDGDKIRHMTKVWPASWALKELGWA
jgi:hypothetical protein